MSRRHSHGPHSSIATAVVYILPVKSSTRTSHSVRETDSIAAKLARSLSGGEFIALHGELGAGKTQFTRGLVRGLGGEPHQVSSPTFVLLNVYDTPRFKVFHLDAYRVAGAEDFEAIGFAELLEQGGVVVVEWPERVAELIPQRRIDVTLVARSPHIRQIEILRS
jgi:tRNA threonylcarbamoyladenosine biosynthesis protein TsaE